MNDTPLATAEAPVEYTVLGREREPVTFTGVLLAAETSFEPEHTHQGDFAPKLWKCRACRWFEVALYRVMDDGQPHEHMYMVHTRGMTVVPDEKTYARAGWAKSPFHVLEMLTQWRRHTNPPQPMLPKVSQDVLDSAADHDPELSDALEKWINAGA